MDFKILLFFKIIFQFFLERRIQFFNFVNGERKGGIKFFFENFGLNRFGDNGCGGIYFDGNGVGGQGGFSFSVLGIDG